MSIQLLKKNWVLVVSKNEFFIDPKICEFFFFFCQILYLHVYLVGDNPYPCSICGFRALTRDGLQSHKAKEHEKMSFPCKECSFTANSRSQLWNHSLVHSGFGEDMGIECPECQQKIGRYRNYWSEVFEDCNSMWTFKFYLGSLAVFLSWLYFLEQLVIV